jgi:hypothetical protein
MLHLDQQSMATTTPSIGHRPLIQAGGIRRSFTQPPRSLSVHERAGLDTSDSAADILYSHPKSRIISFTPPTNTVQSNPKPTSIDLDYPVDTIETLPWASTTEEVLSSGSLVIEKVRGSTNFLKSGTKPLHALMRNSQCWCVDGEAILVLRVSAFKYYRIELPFASDEDKVKVQQLKDVLKRILRFESTPCPFIRGFHVDLPESASTPRKKGPWKRRSGSLLASHVNTSPSPLSLKRSRPREPSVLTSLSDEAHSATGEAGSSDGDDAADNDEEAIASHDEDIGTNMRITSAPENVPSWQDSSPKESSSTSQVRSQFGQPGPSPAPVDQPRQSFGADTGSSVSNDMLNSPDRSDAETGDPSAAAASDMLPHAPSPDDRLQCTTIRARSSQLATSTSSMSEIPGAVSDTVHIPPETVPTNMGNSVGGDSLGPLERSDDGHSNIYERGCEDSVDAIEANEQSQENLCSNHEAAFDESLEISANNSSDQEEDRGSDFKSDSGSSADAPEADKEADTADSMPSDTGILLGVSQSSLRHLDLNLASGEMSENRDGSEFEREADDPPTQSAPSDVASPDMVSLSSQADSFHSLAPWEAVSTNAEDSTARSPEPRPLGTADIHLIDSSPRQSQHGSSISIPDVQCTMTGMERPPSPLRPSTTTSEDQSTSSLLPSSTSASSWLEMEPLVTALSDDGLRRRQQTRRLSPSESRPMDLGDSPPPTPGGDRVTGVLLQKAFHWALGKPVEVVLIFVHILFRIAGGATPKDVMSGDLFRRPTPPAERQGIDQQAGQRSSTATLQYSQRDEETSDEDDFGIPIRGKSGGRVAPFARNEDDADSLFDLD